MAKERVLKPLHFRRAGYQDRLRLLTREERKAIRDRDKPQPGGVTVRSAPEDYDYWFKVVNDVEVRVLRAGPYFYYEGSRLTKPEHLEIIEKSAAQKKHIESLKAQVQDTKPLESNKAILTAESVNDLVEGQIILSGGPHNKRVFFWNKDFKFFMFQEDVNGKSVAFRYKRSKEKEEDKNSPADPRIYYYLETID